MIATRSTNPVRPPGPEAAIRRRCISAFHLFYVCISFAVIPVAWFKGGHPERFAAGLLLIGYLVSVLAAPFRMAGVVVGDAAADLVLTLVFGHMALNGNRWWPVAMTAILVLTLMVHVSVGLTPELDHRADISARIGLGVLAMTCLFAGVVERWLAGERPASETTPASGRVSAP